MNAFNKLHFYKRFDSTKEFVALKPFTWGGKEYKVGDDFDKLSTSLHKVKILWNSRKIAYKEELLNPATIVEIVKEVNLVPEIKKGAFGWLTVMVDGKQIGSKTRDEAEAQKIVNEWLTSND